MERMGDLRTAVLQDVALAVCAKYEQDMVDLDGGIPIISAIHKHDTCVMVLENGKIVFSGIQWQDGDQIVSNFSPGLWCERLSVS